MRSLGINVSLKVSVCIEVTLVIKAKPVWPVKRNVCLSVCFIFLYPDSFTHMTYLWLPNTRSQKMCKREVHFFCQGVKCVLCSHTYSHFHVYLSSRHLGNGA